ncbi:MAG: hypothetical protein WC793_00500 [Candidatus Paceibacterota bacterium]|jgi:hypothetical protein
MKNNQQTILSPEESRVISEAVKNSNSYTDKKLKLTNWIMTAVVIVISLTFIGIVVDTIFFHVENNSNQKENNQNYTDINKIKVCLVISESYSKYKECLGK